MHIIEPHQLAARRKQREKRRLPYRVVAIIFSVAIITAVLGWVGYHRPKNKPSNVVQTSQTSTAPAQAATPPAPKILKTFSGPEFLTFYNTFAYPNVTELTDPPKITGDPTADAHIRDLAVKRGYILRSVAIPPLSSVDGFPLQRLAVQPWIDMKAAAAGSGVRLTILSSFRTVEEQRGWFLSGMDANDVSVGSINAGWSDEALNTVLNRYSIPGYTRHHTGYTIDIGCDNSQAAFAETVCFEWLSANNYENAKQYGWIPSYPDGAPNQGPIPEPWEYVWVGTAALYKNQ